MPSRINGPKRPKKTCVGKVTVVPRAGGLPPVRYVHLVGKINRAALRKAIKEVIAEERKAQASTKEA